MGAIMHNKSIEQLIELNEFKKLLKQYPELEPYYSISYRKDATVCLQQSKNMWVVSFLERGVFDFSEEYVEFNDAKKAFLMHILSCIKSENGFDKVQIILEGMIAV